VGETRTRAHARLETGGQSKVRQAYNIFAMLPTVSRRVVISLDDVGLVSALCTGEREFGD
jgi:hypothetical protein